MGEHKDKAGSPVRNGRHGPEPRAQQSWSTMDNAAKRLFMAVLVVMAGASVHGTRGKDSRVRCERHWLRVVCHPPCDTRVADLAFFEACAGSPVRSPKSIMNCTVPDRDV